MKINWKEYVGERVLLENWIGNKLEEVTVLEVSKSGKVKFEYPNGNTDWREPKDDDYSSIEILEKLK